MVARQHINNLVAVLVFAGLSNWCFLVIRHVPLASLEEWRLAACVAVALLGGQVVRRVLGLSTIAIAVCAFVAHCIVFGLLAQRGLVPASYELPLAIAVTSLAGIGGAVIARPPAASHFVWSMVAVGAIQFGMFQTLGGLASIVGFPLGLVLMFAILAGAALFVAFVADLEPWQLGVASVVPMVTAVLALRPHSLGANDIGPMTSYVLIGVAGGILGRKLRSRLKRPAELPAAQARK